MLRKRRPEAERERERVQAHAEVLAATARMEMELGFGGWRDTLSQMSQLLATLERANDRHRSEIDELIRMLRARIGHLECRIHAREMEFDALQERYCALMDKINGNV